MAILYKFKSKNQYNSLIEPFYYTPIAFHYAPFSYILYLEPSYWQFKKMCKLNELPNNEYKYNKILSYFDLSLDTLDWEGLNKKTWKISEDNGNYKKGAFEYAALTKSKEINSRLGITARLLSNESEMNPYNINQMSIGATWNTRRYVLYGNEGTGFYWSEEDLGCNRITTPNYEPQERKNNGK